jgi:hypothetical protein
MKMAQTFEIECIDKWGTNRLFDPFMIRQALREYIENRGLEDYTGTISVKRIDDLHDMPLSTSMEEKL